MEKDLTSPSSRLQKTVGLKGRGKAFQSGSGIRLESRNQIAMAVSPSLTSSSLHHP